MSIFDFSIIVLLILFPNNHPADFNNNAFVFNSKSTSSRLNTCVSKSIIGLHIRYIFPCRKPSNSMRKTSFPDCVPTTRKFRTTISLPLIEIIWSLNALVSIDDNES